MLLKKLYIVCNKGVKNMKLNIKQINYEEAYEISKWIYQEPYSIYSNDGSDSCIRELLDGNYFSATDEEIKLLGYYCFNEFAQVPIGKQFGVYDDKDLIDVGLGIRPDLCGQGFGLDFLSNGLYFARSELNAKGLRLTVASFNKRAIKVYERIGFKKVNSFRRISEIGEMEFWVMIL